MLPSSYIIVCLQHNSYPFLTIYLFSEKVTELLSRVYTSTCIYLSSPRSGHRFYRHTTRSPRNGPGAQSDRVRCPLKKTPKHPQFKSH